MAHHLGSDRLPKSQLIQYLQKKAKVRVAQIIVLTSFIITIVNVTLFVAHALRLVG